MDDKLILDWMKNLEKKVVSFCGDSSNENDFYKGFRPFHEERNNLKEGCDYITIRCGLEGIYTCINTWKDNKWLAECLDDSYTIAYRELKPNEKFNC